MTAPCPPWCDGTHAPLYACCGEAGDRDHFREIGRVDGGDAQVVVGLVASTDPTGRPFGPCIDVLYLEPDPGNGEPAELLGAELHLSPAEAAALAQLLVRAAEALAVGRAA
ncbi:hypothetical protein [Actinomadura physcomitrii]|uniref:hypothetical protein n=1 Tax=Actinomadura physcomitrii TaxID=2650748 RepID=UPI001371D396|nr:hypothetical protein [Actinomadura physcomitrii]